MIFQARVLWLFGLCALLVTLALGAAVADNDNGRGRHKQIYVVPAPGAVVIDGKFDDWDLSGQIEMFVVQQTRDTQNAKFALMYDEEALYVSGDVNDPTPMMNRHDPQVAPEKAWDADSCQFRLTVDPAVGYPIRETAFDYRGANAKVDTRDDIVHLLLWHYTDTADAHLQMQVGMGYRVPRPDWLPQGLVPPALFTGKYLKRADNSGYSFEYRIPWATLGAKRPLAGGDIVAGTVQFNWSRADGLKTGGGSAWAYDVMSKSGFAFQSTDCWGKMVFSDTGNIPRELVTAGMPPERPLPLTFSYSLPEDAECTVQLFDNSGKSVRILVAQQARQAGQNTERWDGLDDQGHLLPAGEYVWKGIYHHPISARYRFSVHNSGIPPHPTDDNTGGWGGDHGRPQAVCALDDGMVLSWNSSEYGWGIIRTDLTGRKIWGAKQYTNHLASDGIRVYFSKGSEVLMMDVADSRPARFANAVATLPAPAGGTAAVNGVTGLAYHNGMVYVAYQQRNLVAGFETANGALAVQWEVPAPTRLAVRPDGRVAVISEGQVVTIAKDGMVQPWLTTHLDVPTGIAIANDGTAYVANQGARQNVSVYAADGRYLRSVAKEGGRPAKGAYDASGMYMPGGIALDTQGRLWVAETADGPKRVSVWDAETGANLQEFFGSSDYFAYGCIDPARPNEIFAHHVLWEIDWQHYTSKPITTVWRKTEPNMLPPIASSALSSVARIMTADNGRQYMWGRNQATSIVLRRDGALFKPFAAVLHVGSTDIPLIEDNRAAYPSGGTYFWQDGNNDQSVQADELVLMPKFPKGNIVWLDTALNLRLSSGDLLRPQQVSEDGQPLYDIAKAEKTGIAGEHGYFLQSAQGEMVTFNPQKGPSLIGYAADGKRRWYYADVTRWKDALNLPMTKAGRLWGMTGSMGLGGDYFVHQTYFGLNHIFRKDGQYVGAVLRDGRVGGRGPYEGQPEGQGGNFVKLTLAGEDRYFMIHGGQDTRVWEILGLDTINDLTGGVYIHTNEMVDTAREAHAAYQAMLEGAKRLVIVRERRALDIADPVGKTLEDRRGFQARMAYDHENLYVRYDVSAPHELVNGITDPQIIYRGGNLLDLQLATDAAADPARKTPAAGDLRVLVTRQQGKPVAVLFRPKIAGFAGFAGFAGVPIVLTSPTGKESFDGIEVLTDVQLEYRKTAEGFTAVVTIPLQRLGITLQPGTTLQADLGYIFGNAEGTRTAVRAYVYNTSFAANVVDDIPHESRLEPAQWGTATVE